MKQRQQMHVHHHHDSDDHNVSMGANMMLKEKEFQQFAAKQQDMK